MRTRSLLVSRRVGLVSPLLVGLLASRQVVAEEVRLTDADRAQVRQLGEQGVKAYKAGDFVGAVQWLNKAYESLKVPSLGVWSARALEASGSWVEAAERYRQVLRLDLTQDMPEVQASYRQWAQEELEKLAAQIPSLRLSVCQAQQVEAQVSLDGEQILPGLLGSSRPTNPGKHAIRLQVGPRVTEARVALEAGEVRALELCSQEALTPSTPSAAPSKPKAPPLPMRDRTLRPRPRDPWIWILGGAGVAGSLATGVFYSLAHERVGSFQRDRRAYESALPFRNEEQEQAAWDPLEGEKQNAERWQHWALGTGVVSGGLLVATAVLWWVDGKARLGKNDQHSVAFTPQAVRISF